MQKKLVKLPNTAFQIYHNHQNQIMYPLMLSGFLLHSKSQFECSRAVRMLSDWLSDYKTMNQILKHKFINQIPKILKNLCTLFSTEADIRICLAPYYQEFYNQWPELTEQIAINLSKGNQYALRFVWYLSFDFCEKLDAQRQYEFNIYLSQKLQQSLLEFENQDPMSSKPLLQTVRMINIQKAKQEFVENSEKWAERMIGFYQRCNAQSLKAELLLQIIGCRTFLVAKPKTQTFWLEMVNIFFTQIQKGLPNIMLSNQVYIKLLDWLNVIISFEQIQIFLMMNKKRFLKSMVSKMKQSGDPKNAFHYEKYYSLRKKMIDLFFFLNKEESIKEMEEILTQFNRKSLSILKDNQDNLIFFDCVCEMKLPITKTNIVEVIRSLANPHSRKNLPVHVLIVLVRVLHSASEQELSEEHINSVIKSLSECIASKINDPNIFQLRLQVSRFYITLAQKYDWTDQKSTEIMLMWGEEFQRNNKLSTPETIILLRILTKKHKSVVWTSFGHKLEALITDITYKLKYNKIYSNIPLFVSLLMTLYINIEWKQSHKFICQICTDDPEDFTFLYLYQSQILTREEAGGKNNVKLQKKQIQQLKFILQSKEMWKKPSRINVYLYCIEIFFMKISKQQALYLMRQLDSILLKLFIQLFEQSLYPQMIHLAARVFSRIGDILQLSTLESYEYFKNQSFEILSRSFQKHSIMLMTYMYCQLLNRANNLDNFFLKLNESKFLNSLFQGCDQFIGKSPRFYQEYCYVILLSMKAKNSLQISGHSSLMYLKEIQKNIVWWEEANHWVSFRLPFEENSIGSEPLLIEQFKEYYESTLRDYFKEEITTFVKGENQKKLKESQVDEDNDYL